MENIQRDLEKEIAALHSAKTTQKNKHWTLLFVGDHGKVAAFRWFRWVVMLGVFLLVIAVSASGVLYYLYRHTRDINASLQRSLDSIYKQAAGFRRDKEILMTRLIVAENERDRLRAGRNPEPTEKAPEIPAENPSEKQSSRDGFAARQHGTIVSETAEKPNIQAASTDAALQENDPGVLIQEFNVSYEPDGKVYQARFIVRNSGTKYEQISGYAAVVLKKSDTPPDVWVGLPSMQLTAGIPSGNRKGQYFSIFRFKTVKLTVKSQTDPQRLDTARVYIFGEDRNHILLEKDIPIHIEAAVSNSNP